MKKPPIPQKDSEFLIFKTEDEKISAKNFKRSRKKLFGKFENAERKNERR